MSWIQASLPSRRFALAFWMPAESHYLYTTVSDSVRLTIWLRQIPTTIFQRFDDHSRFLYTNWISVWNVDNFDWLNVHPADHYTFPVNIFDSVTSLGDTALGQSDGTYWFGKYNNWDGLPDVVNHKTFTILPGQQTHTSTFQYVYSATVQASPIDGGTASATISFADPWYRDSADSKGELNRGTAAIFHPLPLNTLNLGIGTAYKGVFLNENVNRYSVRAPNSLTGVESFFVKWSGTNVVFQDSFAQQTPVVFKNGSPTPTATAYYKIHLSSSSGNATGSNGQRHLVGYTVPGYPDAFCMVYESAGDLWITRSYDAGATWEPEQKIVAGDASAPSIALSPEDGQYLVYRKKVGSYYQIRCNIIDGGFPYDVEVSGANIPLGIDTRPVIARASDLEPECLWIIWQGANSLMYNHGYKNGSTWQWDGEAEAFGGSFSSPSLSSPDLTVGAPWYLTYDNVGDVFAYSLTSLDEPVPASVGPISYSSQVCTDNRSGEQVHVVWEAYGDEQPPPPGTDRGNSWQGNGAALKRRVMYQEWNGANWQPAHEFTSSGSYYRPTVSNLENGHLAWAWDDGSNTYQALSTTAGTTWTVIETYNNTTQPSLAISASEGPIGTTRFVSTGTSGAPYRLNVGDQTAALMNGPKASLVPEIYSRRVVVARKPLHQIKRFGHSVREDGPALSDSSAYISVELSPIVLKLHDGSAMVVDFVAVDSSADEQSVWTSLGSVPVTLTSSIDSILVEGEAIAQAPLTLNGRELGVSFNVVDADRGIVLRRIGSERVFDTSGVLNLNIRERLVSLAGRRVVLRPAMRGFVGHSENLLATVVHVHTLLADSMAPQTATLGKTSEKTPLLPTAFVLHQNYPNPFNPSTEIKFDLPEASTVSLVIYDVLGRQVAELETGYREAGYRSVTWNASNHASGVYFARFNVTSVDGKSVYSKINKLMLVR